jgi:hypothetical protein
MSFFGGFLVLGNRFSFWQAFHLLCELNNLAGLHWPLLDVYHFVFGLLEHKFVMKRWMNGIERRMGLARHEAKTKAAGRNGIKGGRPRLSALQDTRW